LLECPAPNVEVLETIDADAGFGVIVESVRRCPR
jgi:hypothetical protein